MQVMVYSLVISFAFRLMLRCVLIRKRIGPRTRGKGARVWRFGRGGPADTMQPCGGGRGCRLRLG